MLDVPLPGDHHPLGLGRAGPVVGLRAVAHGGCAQTHILQETHDPLAILGADALVGGEILVADLTDGLAVVAHHGTGLEVRLAGHGDHQATGDVLRQPHDLIGEPGDVLLADVGQQQVDLIVPRLGGAALAGAGDAAGVQRLVEMGHLNELVLDVAGLLHAVVLGGQCRRADDHVAYTHLAAAVALAVIAGEALHHHAGELVLAVEEDVLIGDKHVVENHQRLLAAELGVAHVDAAVLHLAGVAGLAAVDHVQPLGVGGSSLSTLVILRRRHNLNRVTVYKRKY